MCYSGKCKYEDHEGDCTIPWGTANYPDDALCVQNEPAQEVEAQETGDQPQTQLSLPMGGIDE